MHMDELLRLLASLFKAHGYEASPDVSLEGRSGTVFVAPLLVEGERTFIVQATGADVVDEAMLRDLSVIVDDMGADGLILAHLGPRAAGRPPETVVPWSRDRIIHLLGEAALAQSLGHQPAPLPLDSTPAAEMDEAVAQSVTDLMPPAFRALHKQRPRTVVEQEPAMEMPFEGEASDHAPEEAPEPSWSTPRQLPEWETATAELLAGLAQARSDVPDEEQAEARRLDTDVDNVLENESILQGLAELGSMQDAVWETPEPEEAPPAAPAPPPAPFMSYQPPPPQPSASPLPVDPFERARQEWQAHAHETESFPLELPGETAGGFPPGSLAQVAASNHEIPGPHHANPGSHATYAPGPTPGPFSSLLGASPPTASSSVAGTLPVRIDLADARKRVRDRVFSVDHIDLVLQPVHLFDYECDLLVDGSLKTDTADGRIQVNGSDRKALAVDPDQVNPAGPSLLLGTAGLNVTERVLRVTPERAHEAAVTEVLRLHTRAMDVRVPDEDGNYFYTERRKIKPEAQHVRLRPLGVYHRPVWRIVGANGHLDLDAMDGSILDQQLSKSNPDVVLLD